MLEKLPKNKKIILFDGVCNLCNSSINYVIDKDKKDVFRFVALQSDLGKEIQLYLGIDSKNIDSIILYHAPYAYYTKANAALQIMKEFGGVWTLMQVFSILPQVITNTIYDFVAKNRYTWFGKKANCRVPTPDLKEKFLA